MSSMIGQSTVTETPLLRLPGTREVVIAGSILEKHAYVCPARSIVALRTQYAKPDVLRFLWGVRYLRERIVNQLGVGK